MAYVKPETVTSPKGRVANVQVVVDKGPASWSVARLEWDGRRSIGVRWNGDPTEGVGTPQAFGNPTWFIVPEELADDVVEAAQRFKAAEHRSLRAGYEAMAADDEEEREANEWIEGVIGDVD